MKYWLSINKSEAMSFSRKWMELEIIMFSKISQAQKVKYCMFSLLVEPRCKISQ
jgi:hypothetical protein